MITNNDFALRLTLLLIAVFLFLLWAVPTTFDIMEIGSCGVGPAAPRNCDQMP